jgi:hypothetical protein
MTETISLVLMEDDNLFWEPQVNNQHSGRYGRTSDFKGSGS